MKRLLITYLLLMVLGQMTGAQEQLTQAQRADKLYERFEYAKALELYLPIADNRTSGLHVTERIADCYRNITRYQEAEAWYARLTAERRASAISHYYYAEMLLRNQKFEQAKAAYKVYFGKVKDPQRLKLKLGSCDSAALWITKKPGYEVKNERNLNTAYSEYGAAFFYKEQLIFASDRDVTTQIDNRTGNGWFNLYFTDGEGSKPIALNKVPAWNSLGNEYHTGPIAFYKDTAYVTITTDAAAADIKTDKHTKQRLYSRRLQLLVMVKKGDKWLLSSDFNYNDLNKYSTANAALSADGKILYFTSDRPGGYGKTDLWYCGKQADGSWGPPVNCGPLINTADEESFPQIGDDGLLYYASKGLPGMGGYDIYKVKGAQNVWAKPENSKYPINSTSDDFALLTHDGKTGYLSSNRQGGQGSDDIYNFKTVEPAVAKPLFGVADKPIKTGQTFVLRNIYYDLDKYNIRQDAAAELDRVAEVLKEHPNVLIELSSHTDSRADDAYNLRLSQRRADAAVTYLISKGIAANRLIAKGYGETQLIIQCANGVACTEAQHQINRRTEIKVLSE
ncbi:OmpA family protein [Mucilaginibacter glaciei]|uniref:OmpA family protein n=1 Tax=Mucilaginibacter glaciei TaxID=2772109 RepID=A0A926NUM7_9SPHI|nr:OmpA family protein [Mucilaginibacter glaciei]MBD1392044.1 OmpA family protein [Mucilaginibacter glaciei]